MHDCCLLASLLRRQASHHIGKWLLDTSMYMVVALPVRYLCSQVPGPNYAVLWSVVVTGVIATEVGYSQGKVDDPSYEDVCSGTTGHVEVVQVTYNSQQVRAGGRTMPGTHTQRCT